MKKSTMLLAGMCVFALAFALVAAAQEPAKVAGSWELSMEGPQGTMTQNMTLEEDGKTIKGTIKGRRGESPLEGTVDGNKVTFTVKRETPNGTMTTEYNATVDGDNMKGTVKFGQRDVEFTAKRAKS